MQVARSLGFFGLPEAMLSERTVTNDGDGYSGATFSLCGRYRYKLWRNWGDQKRVVAFCGLNPSTADHQQNDPTVTRCINYAKSWGYSGMYMLNLFAWRDTDPKAMKAAPEPIGAENNRIILEVAKSVDKLVCAWGTHGSHQGRDKVVMELLRDVNLYALRVTKGGHPQHPLYLPGDLVPQVWREGIA